MTHLRCHVRLIACLTLLSAGLLGMASGSAAPVFWVEQATQEKADEKTIRDLIRQLGDDSYTKREEATNKLALIGAPARSAVQLAAKVSDDPEIRYRARQILVMMNTQGLLLVRTIRGGQTLGPWVTRVAVTPDGTKVIAIGRGSPTLWEIDSGKQLDPIEGGKTALCHALAVTPDGQRIVVGCDGKAIHVFDTKAVGKRVQNLTGHKAEVRGAAIAADGETLITGSYDETIRVWNITTGKEIRRFSNVAGKVACLALSPDGKTVAAALFAAAGSPATVRLWDLEKGSELRSLTGHTKEVGMVAFSPDGKTLLSAGFDGTVRLWDPATGNLLKVLGGKLGRVENAIFTPDGKRVLSCSGDQEVCLRIWDVETGQQIVQSEEMEGAITGLAVLPDNHRCVTSGRDGTIRLWKWTK
jgi:WD40 repeat protein